MTKSHKLKPLTETDLYVLKLLKGRGACNRQSLQDAIYGTLRNPNNDRRVRECIQHLRDHGYVIISSSRSKGYELTKDKRKVSSYVDEQFKKAKAMMRTARKVARAHGLLNQIRFPSS